MTPSLLPLLHPSPRRRMRALRSLSGGPGFFALRTVLFLDPHAGVRAAAAARLGAIGGNEPARWLLLALRDPSPLVRLATLRSLAMLRHHEGASAIGELLRTEPLWWVRRGAARVLAELAVPGAIRWLRDGLDDPVWRVRLGVIQALAALATTEEARTEILAPLQGAPLHALLAHEHLRSLLTGSIPTARTLATPPAHEEAFVDDDPAVTAARLAALSPGSIEPSRLAPLLNNAHATLRAQVLRHLENNLDASTLDELRARYSDPRLPHAAEALRRLTGGRPPPAPPRDLSALTTEDQADPWRRHATLAPDGALQIATHDPDPWLRRHATSLLLRSLPEPRDRVAVAQALAIMEDPYQRLHSALLLENTSSEEAARIGLGLYADEDPAVRAAALDVLAAQDEARIEMLLRGEDLGKEERKSALLWLGGRCDRPGALALARGPEEERLVALLRGDVLPTAASTPCPSPWVAGSGERAQLGASGVGVSRLVLSGRNEPPVRALIEAHERGVDTFFWEPNYANLTRFLRDSRLRQRTLIAGTYHADARSIERDVERILRKFHIDQIDVFLLFWARSRGRLEGEPREALLRLKEQGKLRAVGFSTHLRGVAMDAMRGGGWDVVMTRHSAAHRGAESQLFPAAKEANTGVLSFSNLCYGRLLTPVPGSDTTPASAADCYRYSLNTTGVHASISAPRTAKEISETLAVLESPHLPEERRTALLAHGAAVYALSQHMNGLVRQAPTDHRPGVRTLALDSLDQALCPPEEAPVEARHSSANRLSWTNFSSRER